LLDKNRNEKTRYLTVSCEETSQRAAGFTGFTGTNTDAEGASTELPARTLPASFKKKKTLG
jgi:hypothetical protein